MRETKSFAGTLITIQLGAVLLFLSWLLPPTSLLWQALDEASFRILNGSLRQDSLATQFWAWLNIRAADLIPAVLLYSLAIVAAGRMAYRQRMRFIYRGLALVVVMAIVITVENMIDLGVYTYHRASPTLVMDDVVRLSQVVPAAKDFSPKSFPGDHGYVLICLAGFFALASAPRYALVAFSIAVFFSLPRLIGGAHWLTDIVVGSGVKALLTTGWLLATPLWDRLADWIEFGLSKLPFNPVTWACHLWWGKPQPDGLAAAAETGTPTESSKTSRAA